MNGSNHDWVLEWQVTHGACGAGNLLVSGIMGSASFQTLPGIDRELFQKVSGQRCCLCRLRDDLRTQEPHLLLAAEAVQRVVVIQADDSGHVTQQSVRVRVAACATKQVKISLQIIGNT